METINANTGSDNIRLGDIEIESSFYGHLGLIAGKRSAVKKERIRKDIRYR